MNEEQQGTATMQATREENAQPAQSQHENELETIIDRLLTNDPSSRHEIFNRLKMDWHATVEEHGDVLATKAGITAKSSIVTRTGKLMLSSGTGAYRVEATMQHVGSLLGVSCTADVSLVSIDSTVSDGRSSFTEVVSLPKTGVNTERIQIMERFQDELEANLDTLTVNDIHKMLDEIEHRKPRYSAWQLGLASGFACFAFVFLLGGGLIEMTGALIGAGFGNFTRVTLGRKHFNHFGANILSVALAGLLYLGTLGVLSLFIPDAFQHEAGYIGALLFVIPGFPLITSGLDFAKFRFASGVQRLTYAGTIVFLATITGWIVAMIVGFTPNEFVPQGLDPVPTCLLRCLMSFVGVFGFSIMFNSTPRMAFTAACIGLVANTTRLELIDLAGMLPESAALIGALIAGLLASFVGIKMTLPRISLTVPSIVIMVPGLYLYRAMYYLGILDAGDALSWGLRAMIIIFCLPIGLALARMLTDKSWRYDG